MDLKNVTNVVFRTWLIALLVAHCSDFGQGKKSDLVSAYEEYTTLPREVAFAHSNKTDLLQGEILGFKAYIFNMTTKQPSPIAPYIYC